MTQVVFHIGDRKTGSTSIQSTLAAGAAVCGTQKLLYPRLLGLTHNILAQAFTNKSAPKGRRDKMFRTVAEEIARQAPDVAVVSAEHFESVEPDSLLQAIEAHMPQYLETTRVIAYVRPHADRLVSEFAEQIKQGVYFGTMEELHDRILQRKRFEFAPRFAKWRAVFGDRFELRPMIRERLYQQDVVADFLHFTFAGAPFEIRDLQKSNESLSLHDLAILHELQKLLRPANGKPGPLQATTGWSMARRMNGLPAEQTTRLRLHRSLAEQMVEIYRDDASLLDATYFTGTPISDALAAAPGKAVEAAQSVEVRDLFNPELVRMIQIWTEQVAEMLLATPDVWPRFFRSTHRVKVTGDESEAAPLLAKAGKALAGKALAGKALAGKALAGKSPGREPGAGNTGDAPADGTSARPGRRGATGPKGRGKAGGPRRRRAAGSADPASGPD